MNSTLLSLVGYAAAILTVALPLGFFNHYVLCDNAANHTGGSPYVLLVVFIPVAVVSVRMLKLNGTKWIVPLLLAVAGTLNVAAFESLHVMQGYSAWIASGMPERPAWSLRACGG